MHDDREVVVLLKHAGRGHAPEDGAVGREAEAVEGGVGDQGRALGEGFAVEEGDERPAPVVFEEAILDVGVEESAGEEGRCAGEVGGFVAAVDEVGVP